MDEKPEKRILTSAELRKTLDELGKKEQLVLARTEQVLAETRQIREEREQTLSKSLLSQRNSSQKSEEGSVQRNTRQHQNIVPPPEKKFRR